MLKFLKIDHLSANSGAVHNFSSEIQRDIFLLISETDVARQSLAGDWHLSDRFSKILTLKWSFLKNFST